MARQKEQPEPTNEPGDPPPAEPKKPAADDVAVCLVRPRPARGRAAGRGEEAAGGRRAALRLRAQVLEQRAEREAEEEEPA